MQVVHRFQKEETQSEEVMTEIKLQPRIELSEEDIYTLENATGEEYVVAVIKRYLRTSEQKAWLDGQDLSIEDLMNGRYGGEQEPIVLSIYNDWNAKLGVRYFGH